ncbi:MAG: hypothetical protein LBT75_03380 [Bacilli bacterium]|jgi:hypothetical protein|nr:hypothetical protein [Bacilli bacterium]
MFNKKGFLSIELILYFIILVILAIIFTNLLMRSTYYHHNENIKIYQSYDILRNSLIKYKEISTFSEKEVIFGDYVKIKINDNKIYEYPGYMPYFQDINNAKFIFQNKTLFLFFIYNNQSYQQVIFYEK